VVSQLIQCHVECQRLWHEISRFIGIVGDRDEVAWLLLQAKGDVCWFVAGLWCMVNIRTISGGHLF